MLGNSTDNIAVFASSCWHNFRVLQHTGRHTAAPITEVADIHDIIQGISRGHESSRFNNGEVLNSYRKR